jgi:3'(2'), 5'-bisphosphate nucleotidase
LLEGALSAGAAERLRIEAGRASMTDSWERLSQLDVTALVPVLAEESFAAGIRPTVGARFILVDPVDGTKEFIAKNGEFTINIALVEDGVPVAGCVYAPALERIYLGGETALAGAAAPGVAIESVELLPLACAPYRRAGAPQ